jgi:hypothetical protein
MFPAFSASSYMERLLRDGGDLDSMDRSLFSCDVSRYTAREFRIVHTGGGGYLSNNNNNNNNSNFCARPAI